MFSSSSTGASAPVRKYFASLVAFIAAAASLVGGNAHAAGEQGDLIWAVTTQGNLISFDSSNTCKILSNRKIQGLKPAEQIVGIDMRPANGKLYGLGSSSQLYVFEGNWATAVGQPLSVTLEGSAFGFDFNPVVDRIRVVSNSGQNLRLHPDTGVVAAMDKPLIYAGGAPVKPFAVGAAYANPDTDPKTGTTLYNIEAGLDLIVKQDPPNDGVQNIVGAQNMNASGLTGFDISRSNVAYAALLRSGPGTDLDVDLDARFGVAGPAAGGACGTSQLVTVDLTTGAATPRGVIGSLAPVRALAVQLR